uniref:Beta-defensin 37 n=1 Tax=Rattus norvegicus TaxID=10116 RepID=Q32ZF9_RAT|nr:beta-defensin 37 [Rattus norvegicus]|eukprot:NP_001032640.1 beta-defensin 37 precursor [Rattus norvegicus]
MKISCFLLLVLSLSCFQINPFAVLDTRVCIEKRNTCHILQCPLFRDVVGTCFEGIGKCCHKYF